MKYFVKNYGTNNIDKFDPWSDEGIFMKYFSSSRYYRVFNKYIRFIEESFHIIFDCFNRILENINSTNDEDE